MEYPDDFETPAFPPGKRISIARVMSIATMVTFLLTLCLCGLLLWAMRSVRVDPFLIAMNPTDGTWTIVGHGHTDDAGTPATQMLQDAVVGNFIADWFSISGDVVRDDARWAECDRAADCMDEDAPRGTDECALFCACGDDVFSDFSARVLPRYMARVAAGERWAVSAADIVVDPVGAITAGGGLWRARATVQSNTGGDFDIVAYVRLGRNVDSFPRTLGYYVTEFNAYKISE